MLQILIVEDDGDTASEIAAALRDAGHGCALADNGRDGLIQALAGSYDAIVLDRMLPQLDGLGLLSALRAAGSRTPVLLLSALSSLDERVKGLRAGGDDYLTKPFETIELVARVEVLCRRSTGDAAAPRETTLVAGELHADLLTREVRRGARVLDLLPREHDLLIYLMRHAGQTVTRTMLFEAVWNYRADERTNVIDVHIARLRRKLESEGEAPLIETVRGAGYVLRAAA
ncbi:response regulator transcription factor [Roseateles sp.]|uniref:response regulator transcription factor n=1 Tax=Roseateles sp. TaxID=1971397 RepID=UPI002F3FCE25